MPLLLDADGARMHHKFVLLDACVLTQNFN